MALVSSQGKTFGGISGLTSVSVKTSDPTQDPSSSLVDVSTLATTGFREFAASPLVDAGTASVDGVTITVTVNFLSDGPPAIGQTANYGGQVLTCTEVSEEWKVGEYVTGSATFTSSGAAD